MVFENLKSNRKKYDDIQCPGGENGAPENCQAYACQDFHHENVALYRWDKHK